MNFLKLAQDHNLDIAPPGDKHSRPGWVNVPCPLCVGNPGYHLGYCVDPRSQFANRFVCWRCGGKGTLQAIKALLNISDHQARNLIAAYGGEALKPNTPKTTVFRPIRRGSLNLPPNTLPLGKVSGAASYIAKRGFLAKELETLWQIKATGPGSLVKVEDKVIDYSYRIIIPIYHEGRLVSYQGRDWTGKNSKKYLACPQQLEIVEHKSILYGLDKTDGVSCTLVEGVTDVWAIGPGAVACFGVKYREPQIRLLRQFREVKVLFDPDAAGKIQARKIITELKESGITVHKVKLPKGKDPAEMNREELRRLLR